MTYSENQTDKQDAVEVKNYTRTPNMLIFGYQNISPQEKWLYVCLKHMCGKKGTRHLSLRYISEQTGISTGALSSSKNAKGVVNLGMMRHLHDSGLIHSEIKKHDGKGNPQYHITITDVWALNQDFFQTRSEFGQDTEESANPSERLTSPSEIRTDIPSTRPNFGQTCPNSGTNIRLDNKTTITDKTTEQKKNVAALADDASCSFPSSTNENENHSSTIPASFPTPDVEKLETNSQPQNSTTPSETTAIVPEKPENTPVAIESDDSTPITENASQVAKQQANGKIRIAATPKKPRKTKSALELVPVLPPSRPSQETPWGVEKCLAWGDYVRKSTLPESTRKDSKSFKAKEAACKIIGRSITENSFLVIFVNWMKGLDLDLNPLTNGALKSETWPDYSVDLWVVDEHYEDEARKYQKAKLTQSSVQTKKEEPSQADEDARRESARIKNQAAFEKVQRIKAQQEQERQAGKKRAI